MKKVKMLLCLVVIAFCTTLSSCTDEAEIFPQEELETGGNGEGTDPVEHGPPGTEG